MKFGYARVSTSEQNLDLQLDALNACGCDRIFQETISSRRADRPELQALLAQLRANDELVVYKLDRIARSTRELLGLMEDLTKHGIAVRSNHEPWANTTTAGGKMIMTVFAGIAEFERDLTRQRTSDGRKAAMARGVKFGRPTRLSKAQTDLLVLARTEGKSVAELADAFNVSPDTIYRTLKAAPN